MSLVEGEFGFIWGGVWAKDLCWIQYQLLIILLVSILVLQLVSFLWYSIGSLDVLHLHWNFFFRVYSKDLFNSSWAFLFLSWAPPLLTLQLHVCHFVYLTFFFGSWSYSCIAFVYHALASYWASHICLEYLFMLLWTNACDCGVGAMHCLCSWRYEIENL